MAEITKMETIHSVFVIICFNLLKCLFSTWKLSSYLSYCIFIFQSFKANWKEIDSCYYAVGWWQLVLDAIALHAKWYISFLKQRKISLGFASVYVGVYDLIYQSQEEIITPQIVYFCNSNR